METFAALLLAHVLADFVFQTNWMVTHKARVAAIGAHVAVVFATSVVAVGALSWGLVLLTLAHLGIDLVKTHLAGKGLGPFLADQGAHLVTLALLAGWTPGLWGGGLWGGVLWLPAAMVLVAGAILATRAGGFVLALLMAPWGDVGIDGLPNGGRIIGHLERGLIFLMILTGQAVGIGFLIAAKSVLRFGTVQEEARLAEYVIIGTLASFAWAIAVTAGTMAVMAALPPLGIPDLTP